MGKKIKINIFQKILYSLTKPEILSNYIKRESFFSTFLYLSFINFIPTLINIVLFYYENKDTLKVFSKYFVLLIASFVIVGIYHILVKIFGGRGTYELTFKAYSYGFTASALFGWIEYIGIIGLLYGSYIFIKMISLLQGIKINKAFFVWLLPAIILSIIMIFLVMYYMSFINIMNF